MLKANAPRPSLGPTHHERPYGGLHLHLRSTPIGWHGLPALLVPSAERHSLRTRVLACLFAAEAPRGVVAKGEPALGTQIA